MARINSSVLSVFVAQLVQKRMARWVSLTRSISANAKFCFSSASRFSASMGERMFTSVIRSFFSTV